MERETGSDVALFDWPALTTRTHFHVHSAILELRARSDGRFLAPLVTDIPRTDIIEIDPAHGRARRVGRVRDAMPRYLAFVRGGLAFVTIRHLDDIAIRGPNGDLVQLTHDGKTIDPSPCGPAIVAAREAGKSMFIVRLQRDGGTAIRLTSGPYDSFPACSPDGSVLFYTTSVAGGEVALMRCDGGKGCRALLHEYVFDLAVSPDGKRVSYITGRSRGAVVEWIGAGGGPVHFVSDTESTCRPVWSSSSNLWVSRRVQGKPTWVEMSADTGTETGRSTPGSKECSYGTWDPATPGSSGIVSLERQPSELRLLPIGALPL